ncbi:AbiJ-NTD4 domain-containing protein [Puniceibacterium sediminis]|uniref:HEPN AbiJ-N-terminal domain-containing protein n=1 Tax=Puniceibacterium sediminis TaxID=1608407 RepID=A0A238YRP3_9RHOB|nr:hypothetical protein [Puniceibacterium sediminis]SNR73680.1 hypothetical protein SAMN06265370_11964 [Puniceibacterium sediminis]
MTSFSERFGFIKSTTELPVEDMPPSLRSGLWDALRVFYFDDIGSDGDDYYSAAQYSSKFEYISKRVQFHYFRVSWDEMPRQPWKYLQVIKNFFFREDFHKVYEFVEFILSLDSPEGSVNVHKFQDLCNDILSRERAQFRISAGQFVRITNELELAEISAAGENGLSHGVSEHIRVSAALYSKVPDADYRNSVKESISAVEAAVRYVTGKKTVGVEKPLKMIESEFSIHPALRSGFEKIFAFTSDADGVRHALLEESSISQADAKFMLVACSAFSNYLITLKSNKHAG